jgi:hypothetical protein
MMRIVLGALSLLVVLAVVSWLSHTQVKSVVSPAAQMAPNGTRGALDPKQVQQQYKEALEDAMNPERPRSPDE